MHTYISSPFNKQDQLYIDDKAKSASQEVPEAIHQSCKHQSPNMKALRRNRGIKYVDIYVTFMN